MFYENLGVTEVQQTLPLGDDLSSNLTFKIPPNTGRGKDFVISHGPDGPYDLSVLDLEGTTAATLVISYYLTNSNLQNNSTVFFDISTEVTDPYNATIDEIIESLNNNNSFSGLFIATKKVNSNGSPKQQIVITKKHQGIEDFIVYPLGAESMLMFNRYSGIAQVPDYFPYDSYVLPLQTIFTNSVANPTVITFNEFANNNDGCSKYFIRSNCSPSVDGERVITVIDDTSFSIPVNVTTAGTLGYFCTLEQKKRIERAGFSVDNTKLDWEHLQGRTSSFLVYNNTVDGDDRITSSIIYNNGSAAGTICKKITKSYVGANTTPNQVVEIPYVLTANDILGL